MVLVFRLFIHLIEMRQTAAFKCQCSTADKKTRENAGINVYGTKTK